MTTTKAQCAPWRPITFDGRHDTPQTVRQIRVHDEVGRKLNCWK